MYARALRHKRECGKPLQHRSLFRSRRPFSTVAKLMHTSRHVGRLVVRSPIGLACGRLGADANQADTFFYLESGSDRDALRDGYRI